MNKCILIAALGILLVSCDDTFDYFAPSSGELVAMRIESAPPLRIDGTPWDEDLAPEYSYTIIGTDLTAVSDTSESITCHPKLLPVMVKSGPLHLESNRYYKLVILDQDEGGQSEVMGSIEFCPFYIGYDKKKSPKYRLSNDDLSVDIYIKWN